MEAFLYTAPTLPASGSVHAAYTAATLELYCLYTPLRSGIIALVHSDSDSLSFDAGFKYI